MRSNWRRRRTVRRLILGAWPLAICLFAASVADAQPPNPGSGLPSPRLFTVSPCGGQQGQVLELSFTGTDLEEPESLLFSVAGIRAEPIVPPPPAPDPKAPADKPPPKPVITKFKVTIARGTPLGIHDVRLVNKWGVSNPRAFVVGDLREALEKEPNNDVEQAQRVELNTTVNGNMAGPTDVDYYVFAGKQGQRVVVSCLASSIDSRFEPGLEMYDKNGRQVAFNRMYDGADALLDYTLPADGDYWVRVFEFTYTRGSPEHFYRLTVSTAPWIDAIVPPVVEPGKTSQLVVYGRNLPGGVLDADAQIDGRSLEKLWITVTAPATPTELPQSYSGHITPSIAALDGFEYRLRNATGMSNPYLISYARAPVVLENGDNDTADKAQEVALPCQICGRLEKKNDRDWYSFQAKKGEVWNLELLGDRMGAPSDLFMVIRNPAAKQDMADLDDTAETLHPFKFFTRSSDPPPYRFTAPADGKYQLVVSSREANVSFGPRHLYVIRAVREQPDFRLFVLPSDDFRPDACQLPKNGEQYFHVLAWRLDGFGGPITITADGLPPGVTCPPTVVPSNLRQISLVLSAPASAASGIHEIKVKGTALINGQNVVREARPAHIVWPGQPGLNLPLLTRLARSTVLAIREQPPYRVVASLDTANVFQGEKANLKLTLTRHSADFKAPVQAVGIDLPPNLLTVNNNQPVTIAPDKTEATVVVDAKANLPRGAYPIVVRTSAQIPFNKDPNAKQKPNINIIQPSTAVTINVLAKQVATLTLSSPNISAKAGTHSEVTVKLARMNDYTGEFKVQLVPPANVKGLAAEEITVPAGKDEAKLVLNIAADMAPAKVADVIVRAIAMQNGTVPTVHEAKLNVTVVK